ncbi:MAG TPA: hypothetical protein VJL57_00470 [Candidatus Paceibacterota bacterium]
MIKTRSYDRLRESLRARHEPGAMRVLSIVYWRTLLCVAALIFLAALLWGWWEFKATMATLDARNDQQQNQAPILTRKDVDDAVAAFDARQNTYERLKIEPLSAPDPSQ